MTRTAFPSLAISVAAIVALGLAASACTSTSNDVLADVNDASAPTSGARGDIVPGARDGNIRVVAALPAPESSADGTPQPIGENDVLEVDVFQVDDLDRTVQVDADGMIALPLIGQLKVAGKSVRQVEAEITQAYGKSYLQSPQVTVFVKESFVRRVTVDGEVRKAGIYPTTTSTSLISVLAEAGGLTELADPGKVYVFRDIGGERLVANYDARSIRLGRQSDPRIYGGDIVVVFASSSKIAMRNLKDVLGVASRAAVFIP